MSLKSEKSADLAEIIAEMGEPIVWSGQTIQWLISAPVTAQEFDIGGIVESADFTEKVARSAFFSQRPTHGDLILHIKCAIDWTGISEGTRRCMRSPPLSGSG